MPYTKQTILNYLAAHIQEFQTKYGVKKIGLFGSYARDEATEESDIDLYVHLEKNTFDSLSGLWVHIENDLRTKVDLIASHARMRPGLKSTIENEVIYG